MVLAIAGTSALVWYGNGLEPRWPLMWLAPLPVLVFASRASWQSTAFAAFVSMFLGSLAMWHYFRVLGVPPIVWLSTYSAVALLFVFATLLFRGLLLRGAPWSAWLAFPATWVSGEYFASLFTSGGTAGSVANTQLAFLPLLQLASITGPWGISFLVMAFPSAVAVALHVRTSKPAQGASILGAALGLTAFALLFGAYRLATPVASLQLRAGLVASDDAANVRTAPPGAASVRLSREYALEARALIARGARLVVLPEKIVTLVDPDRRDVDDIFQRLADETGATVAVGVVHDFATSRRNEARVYVPDVPIAPYDKRSLVPHWEARFTPGSEIALLRRPSSIWGVAICKDMDFTPLSLLYGRDAVGMMLVPAWDFDLDRLWHGHIAVMRGVEDGFSVVRSAKEGYLTVSDARGRIIGETRSDSARFATLVVDVPITHESTLHLFVGDRFAWLALAGLGFAFVLLLRLRKSTAFDPALPGRHATHAGAK